nr:uncharacterized protein LOC127327856 isoform X1 [Lolium perenne]XP_051210622.1 uncharacterized protein LOC127327856 isoform X2 [Lolium perenne]
MAAEAGGGDLLWSDSFVPPHLAAKPEVLAHFRRKLYQRHAVQVVAGLGMVPVLPKHLADRACKLSLLGTVFSLGFSLYRVLWDKYLPTLTLSGSSLFSCVSCPDEHVDLILRFICMKKPNALNMPAICLLQSILGAKDFFRLMFSVLLLTSQMHLKIAALPVFCWAVDHVARLPRRNFAHSSFYREYTWKNPVFEWMQITPHSVSLVQMSNLPCGFF